MSSLLSTFPLQSSLGKVISCDGPFILSEEYGRIFDLTAGGTAFALLGWNNKEINDAINDQLSKYSHLDYKTFDDPNRNKLADLLTSSDQALDFCFLSGASGAEACEMAIHMSYQQHYEEGNKSKQKFITRSQSYHGATSMAMALGDRPTLNFYDPIHPSNLIRVSEPNYFKNKLHGESEDLYCDRLINEISNVIEKEGSDNIAAFVGETCLGGLVGDVPPPTNYWKKVKEICNKNNIHLILDEVWCGTGTSGKYYCYEHDNIIPDFVFLGKTLCCGYIPLSAVLVNKKFHNTILAGSGKIATSSTFQGHSVATASSLAVQEVINQPEFLNRVSIQGKKVRHFLRTELKDYSEIVNIRGRGLRNSIEYSIDESHKYGQYISQLMFKNYRTLVSGKWHRIGLCHALNIEDDILFPYLEKLTHTMKSTIDIWDKIDKDQIISKHCY